MSFRDLICALFLTQILIKSNVAGAINPELFIDNEQKESSIGQGMPPTIDGPVKIYTTVRRGDNVTLQCHVDGEPKPTQSWYKVIICITSEV